MSGKATTRRIENEEGYQRSATWLIEKAEEIEEIRTELKDPLLNEPEKQKLVSEEQEQLRKYDLVSDEMIRYNRAELVKKFPDLRRIYKIIGYEVADEVEADRQTLAQDEQSAGDSPPVNKMDESLEHSRRAPETAAEEPVQKEHEEPVVDLSDWLDEE